jgi:5-methylcytosine-specific restriction protein A
MAWRRRRLRYLKQHPLCEICEEKGLTVPAKDVHHRVAKPYGDDSDANLQGLCHSCHSRITRAG